MGKTVFSDGNPLTGTLGTIVNAAFLNALNNHRHTGRDVDGEGALDYAVATGSGNAYAIELTPTLDEYIEGMPIFFKANHDNTGATTLDVDSLGVVSLKKNLDEDLAEGDIKTGQIICVVYDGTNFQVQAIKIGINYAVATGSSNAYAIDLSPAPDAYGDGLIIFFKANHDNTGAATLNVNSLGAITLKKSIDEDLAEGDIQTGQIVCVAYDGTNFQVQSELKAASEHSSSRATMATAQSIPHATYTKVQWNGETYDLKNQMDIASTYRFTAVEAGLYKVFAQVQSAYISWPVGTVWGACLYKNDVKISLGPSGLSDGTYNGISALSDTIQLEANDYIDIRIYQNQGGAVAIHPDIEINRFTVHKIA